MSRHFREFLSAIDRLDWTAIGVERYLASGTIAALGMLSVTTQFVYLYRTSLSTIEMLFVPGIPLFLSLVVVFAAVWLPGSEYGLYLPRVALWCFSGAVAMVAVGQLVVLSQRPLGTGFATPLFVLGYMQTTGTAIGLVIGLYDGRSEQTKTELDEQRERAERYAQQLSVLNRILRHDLRTGVQVIQDYAQLLPNPPNMEPAIPVNNIQERAREMYETAESARELDELMGTREQLTESVNVSEELESAVDVLAEAHPDARISFLARESATVTASRILDLAFKELITNAIEHNDSDAPKVEIECESTPEAVVVRIADDGPGIPDMEIEPLENGEETPLVHCSGIGLWLANWIADVSGGSLRFDENRDGGTTVTVRLPRDSEETSAF